MISTAFGITSTCGADELTSGTSQIHFTDPDIMIEKDGKTLFNIKDYGCSGDKSKQKIKKFIVHINTNTFPSVHP